MARAGKGAQPAGEDDLKLSARTGCLFILSIGFVLIILLWVVILISVQGEINLLSEGQTGIRLWLVINEEQQGIALSTSRKVSEEGRPTIVCIQTKVRFMLWRSTKPEPTQIFCECFTDMRGQLHYTGGCTP